MSRRFQFSLRALLVAMSAVAIACAIWIRLPVEIRGAIVIGVVWTLFCLPELSLPYAEPQRLNKTSEE